MSLLLATLWSLSARAETVRVVLDLPLHIPSAGAREAALDGRLPAGASFNLDLPVADGVELSAVLELWPLRGEGCEASPPAGVHQLQVLGMALVDSDRGDRVLRARVSPLQARQAYCLRVVPRLQLSGATLDALAAEVADGLVRRVSVSGAACPRPGAPELAAEALVDGLASAGLGGLRDAAGVVAEALGAAQRGGAESACDALIRARVLQEQATQDLARVEAVGREARAALHGLPALPAPTAPRVLVDGRLVALDTLLARAPGDAELEQAAAQLRRCTSSLAASCAAWARVAEGLIGASAADRDRTLAELRRQALPAPPEANLVLDGQPLALSDLRRPEARFDAHEAALQIEQLAAGSAEAARWVAALRALDRVEDRRRETRERQLDAQSAFAQARDALRAVWVAAIASEAVSRRLIVEVEGAALPPTRARALTEGANNYVTPTAGAALALPSTAAGLHAWSAPYVGVNLYSLPAERVIPLGELAGDHLRQRLSLTAGALLDPDGPTLPGLTTQPAFRNAYPLLALNARLMSHVGLAAGAVWMRVDDPDPSSAASALVATPFVGASVDLDVVRLLSATLAEGL